MTKTSIFKGVLALLLFGAAIAKTPGISWSATDSSRTVYLLTYEGIINPVSSELMLSAISKADKAHAEALVIQLDTPGGLDTAMRETIKGMIASEIPIVVYIAPSGARAASAGVFLTLAAHIAAMAPGTNIGAAHPVSLGGGEMDEEMKKKVENDAAAYIRSIAEQRGRNAKWAEDAVRKSVSATEKEAKSLRLIDVIAEDLPTLLKKIDGRVVETAKGKVTLHTAGAEIKEIPIGFRLRVLKALSDPNVAYILMLLGIYGLIFELSNPGSILPGVVGAISLILAFYAFQTLPINYAGLLLILLSIVLFVAEVKVQSFGILGLGGVIAFLLGSLMLFSGELPTMRISLGVVLPSAILTALFFLVIVRAAWRAHMKQPMTGSEGLVGLVGVARSDIDLQGQITIHGEIWEAESEKPIPAGEKVRVLGVNGLKVRVEQTKKDG
ncbi:MAG TPA: nodulation protein NfeD [Nitrospiria bacterium]|nr:nodulation protein NfeD [Nitrospiria bacterium]